MPPLQSEFSHFLPILQGATKVYLAYSGGRDSSVLLHLCHQLDNLVLVHFNYKQSGANYSGDLTATFCRAQAKVYQLEIIVHEAASALVQENACRKFRYRLLRVLADQPNTIFLTAHHFNDQLETLCLKLARGASPQRWLIAEQQPFGQGVLLRPLLNMTRVDIEAYRAGHHLPYLHDPTNDEIHFRRNYLRHQVIRPLMALNPHNFKQALTLLTEQNSMMQQYLNILKEQVLLTPSTITLAPFLRFTPLVQRWLLQEILHSNGVRLSAGFLQQVCKRLHLRRWHYQNAHYTLTLKDQCFFMHKHQHQEIFS